MQRTQPDGTRSGPGDTDRSLYSVRRFIHLAAGNPSIEEWPDRCVQLDRKMSYFEDYTRIGPGPDRERIEAWSARVHMEAWS